jgi:AcrR family transcriptional regulator|tara:strand:+ start:469 stop:957 length:489 start_codon:yes stop_codon:yes gene_type:complete
MRALARAAGMKLGALQYHFSTSEEMLRALVNYIAESYKLSFDSLSEQNDPPDVYDIVTFVMDDEAGKDLMGDRLWPQLWAMQQVEPIVSELVEDIYAQYIKMLEDALRRAGSDQPKAEALCLISMLEGSTVFMGHGRRWRRNANAARQVILAFIEDRYGAIA